MLKPRGIRRDDAGFTLIELTIAVVLLGVVMGGICAAMLASLKISTDSEDRLGDSADVQFASTWFGDDVAGANEIVSGGPAICGSDVAIVVQFRNRDQAAPTVRPTVPASPSPSASPAPVALRITYALRPVTTSEGTFHELHRLVCTGSGTLRSDDVIARRLSATASIPTPTVTSRSVSTTFTPATDGAAGFTLHGTRRSS